MLSGKICVVDGVAFCVAAVLRDGRALSAFDVETAFHVAMLGHILCIFKHVAKFFKGNLQAVSGVSHVSSLSVLVTAGAGGAITSRNRST